MQVVRKPSCEDRRRIRAIQGRDGHAALRAWQFQYPEPLVKHATRADGRITYEGRLSASGPSAKCQGSGQLMRDPSSRAVTGSVRLGGA
jgi:hypothetical protein